MPTMRTFADALASFRRLFVGCFATLDERHRGTHIFSGCHPASTSCQTPKRGQRGLAIFSSRNRRGIGHRQPAAGKCEASGKPRPIVIARALPTGAISTSRLDRKDTRVSGLIIPFFWTSSIQPRRGDKDVRRRAGIDLPGQSGGCGERQDRLRMVTPGPCGGCRRKRFLQARCGKHEGPLCCAQPGDAVTVTSASHKISLPTTLRNSHLLLSSIGPYIAVRER